MGGSGGNFDEELPLKQGKIVPAGPLTQTDNTMSRIYVWVVQMRDNGDCAAYASAQSDPAAFTDAGADSRWTTAGVEPSQHGTFQPGPAIGSALGVAIKPNGDPENPKDITVSWWSDSIVLKEPPATGA